MIVKCKECGKEFDRLNRSWTCPDCRNRNLDRICIKCGKEFHINRIRSTRRMCYECMPPIVHSKRPVKQPKPKGNTIAEINAKARAMGMTYGKYTEWLRMHPEETQG